MKFFLIALSVLSISLPALAEDHSAFDRIIKTGTLRCGYAVWYPNMIVDPNTKQLSGVSHDLMEEIGRRTGIKIEWAQEAGFGSAEQDLRAGKYDMLCADVCFEVRRTKNAWFSRPFYSNPNYLAVRVDDTRFDKDLSLANKPEIKIATYANTIFDSYKNDSFPNAQGVDVSELGADVDTMMALVTKKVDATFNNKISIDRYNEFNGGKIKSTGEPVGYCNGSFMMGQDEAKLKYLIDSAIEEITANGTMAEIMTKYLPEKPDYWTLPPTTLKKWGE